VRRGLLVLLFALCLAAVVFLMRRSRSPTPTTTEQPRAPVAPPRRALQADAEGYYEPGYRFTVRDLRFTRLTLRPEPFVTFTRTGTRQEAGCFDAVIRADTVHLRCELDRVGIVTIDGRFLTRFVTTGLDTPVLSAFVTIRNTRGETVYRARDSFVWTRPSKVKRGNASVRQPHRNLAPLRS